MRSLLKSGAHRPASDLGAEVNRRNPRPPLLGYRHPPAGAECAVVTFNPGAACFRLNSARRTIRKTRRTVARRSRRDDLVGRLMLFDVALQDRVEDVVGRQRVLIRLVGPQLRRRRLRQGRFGDHRASARSFSQRATR